MHDTIHNSRAGIFPHQESKILFRRIYEDITGLQPTTHEERTQKHFAPFLLRIYRKGKGNNKDNQSKEEQRTKGNAKRERERQIKANKGINRGKHATSHITA